MYALNIRLIELTMILRSIKSTGIRYIPFEQVIALILVAFNIMTDHYDYWS